MTVSKRIHVRTYSRNNIIPITNSSWDDKITTISVMKCYDENMSVSAGFRRDDCVKTKARCRFAKKSTF